MPILGVVASSITGNLSTSAYYSLDTYLFTTAAESVTFSNIDQGFKHLFITIAARSTGGNADVFISPNVVTTGYTNQQMYVSGSGFQGNTTTDQDGLGLGNFLSAAANLSGLGVSTAIVNIADYSATKYKQLQYYGGQRNGDVANAQFGSAFLSSSDAPITSIRFRTQSGNPFGLGSRISLYGLKG